MLFLLCVFPTLYLFVCTCLSLLSVLCSFSVAYLLFVRHLGGILAVANIRGGGEYGLTWHKGTIQQKYKKAVLQRRM